MRFACLFVAVLAASCGGSTSGANNADAGVPDGGSGHGIFIDCAHFCFALEQATCGQQPTGPTACMDACPSWTQPACTPWQALVTCAGPDPQIVCVADSPYIVGCQDEYESVIGCTGLPADGGSSDGPECSGGFRSCVCPDKSPGTMYCLPDGHLSGCVCGDR